MFFYFIAAFFALGLGTSAQCVAFALMAEQCSANYLAAGLGFNNAIAFFFGSIFSPFIGWLLSIFSAGNKPTIVSYQHSFLFIILMIAIGTIISLFFLEETFCRSKKVITQLSLE